VVTKIGRVAVCHDNAIGVWPCGRRRSRGQFGGPASPQLGIYRARSVTKSAVFTAERHGVQLF